MYKIKQLKYSNDTCPKDINLFQVQDGISNNYAVVQLGIQAPVGTRFLINAVDTSANSDIEIGITGIFELDLKEANTYITWLSITYIPEPENALDKQDILIDFLYES